MPFAFQIIVQGFAREPVMLSLSRQGCVYCPVCGSEQPTFELNIVQYFFGATERCLCCKTNFGIDDVDEVPPTPENPADKRWARLRQAWLEREGWKPELVEQVRSHLRIDLDVPPQDQSGEAADSSV